MNSQATQSVLTEVEHSPGTKVVVKSQLTNSQLTNSEYQAILAAQSDGVVLYDRQHWGLIQLSGRDRLRYLHNQSTNAFQTAQPGESRETVFVTSTARTLDLVTAYILTDTVLLLVSPARRQSLLLWMDRYIFPADQVELEDKTDELSALSLMGEGSTALLQRLGAKAIPDRSEVHHWETSLAQIPCRVAFGTELALPGYTLVVSRSQVETVKSAILADGASLLSEPAWVQLRILQGRPMPDYELTEDYNPLEAGLWHTISFSKGCYIGQETIARLKTYNGVKQHLWGFELTGPVEPGTPLTHEDVKAGLLTSMTHTETGWRGLGYLRTKISGVGSQVQAGSETATAIAVPFLKFAAQANFPLDKT